jgi:hypothetical protein
MGAFEEAARMLDNGDPQTEILMARVLCSLGGMCSRGGALEKAREALERSWQLYVQHNVLPIPGQGLDPRVMLAYIYLYQGSNINVVEQLLGEALQDLTMREDRFNLPIACFLLAMLARVQGKYEEARQYAQQGYACTVRTGDAFIGAFCLEEWGTLPLGDTAMPNGVFSQLRHSRDFRDPEACTDTLQARVGCTDETTPGPDAVTSRHETFLTI